MSNQQPEQVLCHSGAEYAEYPVVLFWQGDKLVVEQILARWRSPQGKYFRVRTRDGQEFELRYDLSADSWRVIIS